ncbi:LysR family transcriptional regulator [Sphingomonas baiyangensis]|uniref:LysR family transcriptional regulator n=2 Tax=Sphingomonas baiyangensis TaxID=2572576 RepID=A0A4U1L5J7_9SPHN|nr:LysR family transcriptional regulator [Sphingomonas baiyangensis]
MRLASDRIGVAVSSISRQIAQLENELGLPLIERGRRTIRLTEAGQIAYEHYKAQIVTREALYESIQQLREVKAGHVELAVGEGFLCRAFIRLIEDFQREHPGVSVSLKTRTTPDAARLVVEDEAHMGVIFTMPNEPRLRTRVSIPQPLLAVCAPDHPAAREQELCFAQLQEHKLCLPSKAFRISQIVGQAEQRQHQRLRPCLTTDSIYVMRAIAKEGRALTLLPHIAIVDDLHDGTLVALPLTDVEVEEARMALVHRVGRPLDGVPGRMLNVLQSRFRALFEVRSAAPARRAA